MTWRLGEPWWLLLLALPLALALWRPRRGGAAFGPYALLLASVPRSRGPTLWRWTMVLGLTALVVAAARPQWGQVHTRHEAKGRDLVIVVDLSLSMVTDDMFDADDERVDRLRAVVDAAERFIAGRPNDRIGLVFFAETAQTSCPVTFDHATVVDFLHQTERRQRAAWDRGIGDALRGGGRVGLLGDGTNLGLGLGTALRRLADLDSRGGKAIVLVTDGKDTKSLENWVDPVQGAHHAAELGINLYAIGVGDPDGTMTDWVARYVYNQERVVSVRDYVRERGTPLMPDMQRLEEIVRAADGLALHATDRDQLDEILKRIDRLEPSPYEVEEIHDYHDRFWWPLALGLVLVATATLLEPRLRGPL